MSHRRETWLIVERLSRGRYKATPQDTPYAQLRERLPPAETGVVLVPPVDVSLAQAPAEPDRPAVHQGREVDQTGRDVAQRHAPGVDLDARPPPSAAPGRGSPALGARAPGRDRSCRSTRGSGSGRPGRARSRHGRREAARGAGAPRRRGRSRHRCRSSGPSSRLCAGATFPHRRGRIDIAHPCQDLARWSDSTSSSPALAGMAAPP